MLWYLTLSPVRVWNSVLALFLDPLPRRVSPGLAWIPITGSEKWMRKNYINAGLCFSCINELSKPTSCYRDNLNCTIFSPDKHSLFFSSFLSHDYLKTSILGQVNCYLHWKKWHLFYWAFNSKLSHTFDVYQERQQSQVKTTSHASPSLPASRSKRKGKGI